MDTDCGMNATVTTVPWEECLCSLRTLFPTAQSIDLNAIHMAMETEGHKPKWRKMSCWEDLNDMEIFHGAFGRGIINGRDNGILIPNLCFWKEHLPFLVNGDLLEQFIGAFLIQYQEAFFNGDTVLLFPAVKTICLFHHEGACLKYRCEPAR
jgi:hypothetical protein